MQEISLGQASKFTSPNPLTVVCTETPVGKTNLAPVSWWSYLSFNPNIISFAMAKTSYSGEMVRENKQVVLSMPGASIADEIMACGGISGRDIDKAEELAIELIDLPEGAIKVPAHSRIAIQCQLINTVEAGDHWLYLCTVEHAYAISTEEALFAWNGYAKLCPAKIGD